MKYVYIIIGTVFALFLSHSYTYKMGQYKGKTEAYIEYQGDLNAQMQAMQEANKKIVDFQKKIANNNDECFNRLWSTEVIESVNPQLKGL